MLERIDPLTIAFNQSAEEEADPEMGQLVPDDWRGDRTNALKFAEELERGEMIDIPGPRGPIQTFVYRPDNPRGIVLQIHGGGWVFGSHLGAPYSAEQLAEKIGAATFAIDYGLAPEYPYPAAPDDCEAAALWLIEHASEVFGTDKIVITGASAGAHLAAVTLCRLRDRHGFTDISGAVLTSGIYDLRLTPSARAWKRRLIWNLEVLKNCVQWFAGDADLEDPDVSPLLADLSNLPPALFIAGTEEALIDDTLFMHARWKLATGNADLMIVPGGPHVPIGAPVPDGEVCIATRNAFMSRAFA